MHMNERLSNEDHTLSPTGKKMETLPAVCQHDLDYIAVKDYYFCIFFLLYQRISNPTAKY
jgi:hypothetical protein